MKDEIWADFDEPWCQALINSPEFEARRLPYRRPPGDKGKMMANNLLDRTLKSEDTIRAWIGLAGKCNKPECASPEYILIASLGTGLDGVTNIAHGGFSALLLDQIMAQCTVSKFGPAVTREAWIRYKRAIPLPSIVVCRAVVTERMLQGQDVRVEASIDDGRGTTYCEGGSIFRLRKRSRAANM